MDLDFTQDFLIYDNVEVVTYYSRTTETPPTTNGTTISNALREVMNKTEGGPGGALLTTQTAAFHVAQAQLGAVTPKVGDVITDATNKRWVVEPGLDYEPAMTEMWRLPVREEQMG